MGEITAAVHAVAEPCFGPVNGPGHARWSEAVVAWLHLIAEDIESCGLDAADLRHSADAAQAGAQVLDEVTVPRLLTGDLWTVNTMLAPAPVPTICGVLDMDRTWWGDPEADWPTRMARVKQDSCRRRGSAEATGGGRRARASRRPPGPWSRQSRVPDMPNVPHCHNPAPNPDRRSPWPDRAFRARSGLPPQPSVVERIGCCRPGR
ncbi:hypothetical protein [Streptomyces sp. NPDC087297]|uniref:hypothetical protein n=1 Tax=Streptomyces sp. NPDC087297 TaxID=3365778 RepID=UPI0037FE1603